MLYEAHYLRLRCSVFMCLSLLNQLSSHSRLQQDLRNQPWATLRFRKQFGPKRVPYNNKSQLVAEYRAEWIQWFLMGGLLGWPLGTRVGRWAQTYQGGVPVVPYNRWVEEWPNVDAQRTTRKFFRRYAFGTCFITGFALAKYMTDTGRLRNRDYTRPDFKPKAAMVKDTSSQYDTQALSQLQQAYSGYQDPGIVNSTTFANHPHLDPSNKRKSTHYRFFFPLDANYSTQTNPYSGSDPLARFDPVTGSFPTLTNDYADHKN